MPVNECSKFINCDTTLNFDKKSDHVPNTDKFSDKIKNLQKRRIPRRYVLCLLTYLGFFAMHSMRINLGVAIVAMTSNFTVKTVNNSITHVKEFDWSAEEKGFILSSFFYGYTVAEVPNGWLGGRYGGATIYGVSVALTAFCTMLLPSMAYYGGSYATFAFRALTGIFEAGSIPLIHAIWSRWAPQSEKTLLMSLSTSGSYSAKIVCFPLYGVLATYIGWRYLFYIPGIFSMFWCVVWFSYARNDPFEDPRITEAELKYIQSSTGYKSEKKIRYPWKKILTSVPVWTIILCAFFQNWGFFFLYLELPSYLNEVWKMSMKELGFWLSIPDSPVIVVIPLVAYVSDYIRQKQKYSLTTVSKVFQCIAGFGPAICLFLIPFSGTPMLVIGLLTMATIFQTFCCGSLLINPLDLAPEYASVIMGMVSTSGCISAMISPTLTGYIVSHQSSTGWTTTFIISGATYVIASVIYLLFASAEKQSWATSDQTRIMDAVKV